jgi:ribose transport system permease protein
VLIASTSLCKVFRYWTEGPRKGELEVLIDDLPGLADNINRASDGNYWLALVGIRSPAFDLAMRNPGLRLRMVKQVPIDEWLAPGMNHGCVLKFTETGEVLGSWWDPSGISHSTLTSMREHKGYLYLGGLENNRIGRIKLDGVDETWTGYEAYWGNKRRDRG